LRAGQKLESRHIRQLTQNLTLIIIDSMPLAKSKRKDNGHRKKRIYFSND